MSKVRTPATLLSFSRSRTHISRSIGQVAFRSFFSITPTLIQHPAAAPAQPQPAFSLIFDENPLTDFVELPEEAVRGGLVYAKILEGVVRGAMEMASRGPLAGCRLLFSLRLN